jgi:hypothetical protein
MPIMRYFDNSKKVRTRLPAAVHSQFLRTGRIDRNQDNWHEEEKRFLTHEEVARITGKRLQRAGETTHERLNGFHRAIQFPKLIFHKTLAAAPHLGYCHVTASKTKFADYDDVTWGFYIANFLSEIGDSEEFFKHIDSRQGRMYFAVAMTAEKSGDKQQLIINKTVRGNGLLFRTTDPKTAMKNVLMLGARNEQLRAIVKAIG